jgi:putative oxidoreductase
MTSIERLAPYALALLRIVAGALFLQHGLIKLIGFPSGIAPGQLSSLMSQAGAAAIIETVTGILLILGLFTRAAAFIASGEMAVAYWQVHFNMNAPGGIYPAGNRGEAAVLFCFVFFYLIFAGAGVLSLDSLLHKDKKPG